MSHDPVTMTRELARVARQHELAEIDYRNSEMRIQLVFERNQAVEVAVATNSTHSSATRTEPVSPAAAPVEETKLGATVNSPLAGVFYRSPRPGAASFVEAGSTATAGQTLCIVEAMKLMNELTAETPMKILRVLVENGTVVASDQPLFEYEPLG
jgi:acetyl-CoA carboxylase biotin carboxyl carrier protein